MRSGKVWGSARSVAFWRRSAIAAAALVAVCFITGCGPSRPDPLAVVKDGGDEEDVKAEPRAAQKPAADRAGQDAKPVAADTGAAGAGAGDADHPAVPPSGTAPFDLSFLPADTELVLVAKCGDIARSSLVQTVIAGRLSALEPIVEGFGARFADIETMRIGIRNLQDVPTFTRETLIGTLRELSLRDLALNPDIASTIVLQTRERIDETPLRKHGDEVRVGEKRYYRLKSDTFQSTCAYIAGFRTLIVADEPTILAIVEAKGPPSRPQETFSFAREADLVIAVAPRSQPELQRWLPPLDLVSPDTEENSPTPDEAAATDGVVTSDEEHSVAAAAIPGASVAAPDAVALAADSAAPGSDAEAKTSAEDVSTPAVPVSVYEHVTGAALMINLREGAALGVAFRCDSPEGAELVEQKLREVSSEWQTAAEKSPALPGGIRGLVESLATSRMQTIAALTAAVAGERQADLLTLPGLVLGEPTEGGSSSADAAASDAAPPDAFAQQILLEGVPALAAPASQPGMELRGLARWQPSPAGSQGPRQLELGVVAFGGAASTAVAVGHFQLDEAEVNRLSPLKWVGTSPLYSSQSLNPIDGLVPIRRESDSSLHPKNGVLAVFTVVPSPEPATHLRRFRGRFLMRYHTISNEVVVPDLRAAIRTATLPQDLSQAGIELDLTALAGVETLEVLSPASTHIGEVRLLAGDGTPLDEIASTSISSAERMLRTLSTGGMLPDDVGLSLTLNSELAEVEVPFEFINLPIPDVGTLSDKERSLLAWRKAEADSGLPEGLLVEAQARWDDPDAPSSSSTGPVDPLAPAVGKPVRYVLSDTEDERNEGRSRPGSRSERPLRVLVDLTGPLLEDADALGGAQVTSIQTDFRTELNFEGAYFRRENAAAEAVPIDASGATLSGPPGGLRVQFRFTPPLEPIQQLARFNGSVQLRLSQNRVRTEIRDLHERAGRRVTNRELSKLGLALVTRVEKDQILVRILEGNSEQISRITAVDTYGDPVPGVVVTRQESSQPAAGSPIFRLEFPNGVPTGVGLQVTACSAVRTLEVPFRFTDLPVPPAPGLPGL